MTAMNLLARWRLMGQITGNPRLSAGDVAVAWLLLDMHNMAKGCSWPGYETIAERTGRSRSTVGASIDRLVRSGYFERVKGGRYRSNQYRPIASADGPDDRTPTVLPA